MSTTSSKAAATVSVLPAEEADLPALHELWLRSFAPDVHTLFKMHEKQAPATEEMPIGALQYFLGRAPDKGQLVKAVDADGAILGWSAWGFHNLDGSVPATDADSPPEPIDAPIAHPSFPDDPSLPPIARLKNKTSAHMFTMQERLNRPGSRVVYTFAIAVDPAQQARGRGSAMIAWATRLADEHGASMWVHLADNPAAVRVYEKAGFTEVSRNEVDLDEYRTREMPEGRQRWGRYAFRCMRREAGVVS